MQYNNVQYATDVIMEQTEEIEETQWGKKRWWDK